MRAGKSKPTGGPVPHNALSDHQVQFARRLERFGEDRAGVEAEVALDELGVQLAEVVAHGGLFGQFAFHWVGNGSGSVRPAPVLGFYGHSASPRGAVARTPYPTTLSAKTARCGV